MSYPCYATLVRFGNERNQVWEEDGEFHDTMSDGRSTKLAHLYREQMAPGAKIGDRARLELREDGRVYAVLLKKE